MYKNTCMHKKISHLCLGWFTEKYILRQFLSIYYISLNLSTVPVHLSKEPDFHAPGYICGNIDMIGGIFLTLSSKQIPATLKSKYRIRSRCAQLLAWPLLSCRRGCSTHVDGGMRMANLHMVTMEKTAVLKRICLTVHFVYF